MVSVRGDKGVPVRRDSGVPVGIRCRKNKQRMVDRGNTDKKEDKMKHDPAGSRER